MSVIFFGAIGAAASARACQIPTSTLSVKLSTGAPTMMPSKSPGKRWADIRPWRPPVEQPSK
jgi:hypothetical protein